MAKINFRLKFPVRLYPITLSHYFPISQSPLTLLPLILFISLSCTSPSSPTLFVQRAPEDTQIHFSNPITENDTMNIMVYEYIYNGGGVAIGDVNQDSLPDIFFTGNQVHNRLYLNQGDFTFKDISSPAGITAADKWCSGVTMVDINADGLLDIYVAATVHQPASRRANLLFVNQGADESGIPRFEEQASEWGIADTGHSIHSAFLDFDRDGDLDLYVLTNEHDLENAPNVYRSKLTAGQNPNTDRLYRNNGDGTFTNISQQAGILIEGYGLGVSIVDINLDHWPDIYVTNDYVSNDLLYINNQDGTFTNRIDQYFKHQSHSAMGNDVADINNDGWVDLLALDMQPENNERKKRLTPANNYATYINNQRYEYQYQYARNTLQLNNGIAPDGQPTFSEIGQLSGIHETDWSWSPLIADYNSDGFRDILITNGFPKDVTDQDFGFYRANTERLQSPMALQSQIPVVKIPNYAYQNKGNLVFEKATTKWGLDIPSFSNGAAYGDLDRDGDLDYVVNNINDSAFVFENQLEQLNPDANYLNIYLKGDSSNTMGLGTKLIAYSGSHRYYHEHAPTKGYLSCVEPIVHFGLGDLTSIDSLAIYWPNETFQLLTDIPVDQTLYLTQQNANDTRSAGWLLETFQKNDSVLLNHEQNTKWGLSYLHEEQDKVDFNIQKTLPHKYTQGGPCIAVADVNNDNLEDVYIGGSANQAAKLYIQQPSGTFLLQPVNAFEQDATHEDMGALWFDVDMDGDQDLYVVSGSYEFPPGDTAYLDRLYINKGKGLLQRDRSALPQQFESGSCVKAADFDRDGDLDLFVGGRVVPGAYPLAPRSFLFVNEGGRFTDQTATLAPELANIGMISDAIWSDVDNDGWFDLLLAGEWMPITLFHNQSGKLTNITQLTGINSYKGWWNSLSGADFDGDGDTDFIAGNLGLNTRYKASDEYPLSVYAADYDHSGNIDPILVCYTPDQEGRLAPYPMHTRDDLIKQMNMMRKRFPRYEDYSKATIKEVLTEEEQEQSLYLEATYFENAYIENLGNNQFHISALPIEAQIAPIYGIEVVDINRDGKLDVLAVGNNYSTEVFTGRYDASEGLCLLGDGTGKFTALKPGESGWHVPGDAKALVRVQVSNHTTRYLASQNRDSLRTHQFSGSTSQAWWKETLQPLDAWVIVKTREYTYRSELYYGTSYLSQSGRFPYLLHKADSLIIYDYQGNRRVAAPKSKLPSF